METSVRDCGSVVNRSLQLYIGTLNIEPKTGQVCKGVTGLPQWSGGAD